MRVPHSVIRKFPPLVRCKTPERVRAQTRKKGAPEQRAGLSSTDGGIVFDVFRWRTRAAASREVSDLEGHNIFALLQAWWLTTWFRVLCGVVLLGSLWALFQVRVRQLARKFDLAVEARVREHARGAPKLQDTLLQNFQGFVLQIQTVQSLLATRQEEAQRMLENAIDQAVEAIAEGRSAVQGEQCLALETYDFSKAISTLGEELANDPANRSSISLRVDVQGTPRPLRPLLRDEIYRIGAEALRNAFRHAEAQQIEVELRYHERWFELRVRDDGKGVDPRFLRDEAYPGHYGLARMRQRAKVLGGALAVRSAPASGTELVLTLPGAIVYGAGP
jgi:signal transduction histidine kinase